MLNISHMFQDDTFEGYNYFLSSQDDTYQVEADSEYIKAIRSQIEAAMAQGKTYLDLRHINMTYIGRYYNETILEVYWG
jgi:hypothetical protein